jgi:hypothetical protein
MRRLQVEKSISNLASDLIGQGLKLTQREAFYFYQRNIHEREPPFSRGEYIPCAIAILLLTSGLDYHLARLKYFRDVDRPKPPLPHTPYFNWIIDAFLVAKIERLLIKRTEKRLKEQLIELTVMRDSIAHPKLYVISQLISDDFRFNPQKAKLSEGANHKPKALTRKLKRSERTKSLRLPLVPTWVSYVDMVICILVLNRFLNLLEETYGKFYSLLGRLESRNSPSDFFSGWRDGERRFISMEQWAQAFFDSLSPTDQEKVQKRLGTKATRYIAKQSQVPEEPEFLRKPPPWPILVQQKRKATIPRP